MRIQSQNKNQVQSSDLKKTNDVKSGEAKAATKNREVESASQVNKGDAKPEVSQRAKLASKALAVAKESPDVREGRIAELKKKIGDGSYTVNAEGVADRLIKDHMTY